MYWDGGETLGQPINLFSEIELSLNNWCLLVVKATKGKHSISR